MCAHVNELATTLKELKIEKQKLVEQACIYDNLVLKYQELQNNVQRERSKNKALTEELGRPMNIHRWRFLEHRNPPLFEKIQKA